MKCHIWIHDDEILHEFIIWIQIWIHDHKEYCKIICQNSYACIHLWIHDGEFMIMKSSYMNLSEFIIMNSCVNSVLWRVLWNHGWILGNEFTYEIMVEFIHLKLFLIQLQSSFSKGKCLLIKGNHHPSFAVSSLQAQDVEGLVSTWCT